jgi:hypothetical protein
MMNTSPRWRWRRDPPYPLRHHHNATLRSRSELAITGTELALIAALAIIGLSRSANQGVEHARRDRDRHPRRVEDEGEEQTLSDVRHGCPAEMAGAHDASQTALDERHPGAFHGDVSSDSEGERNDKPLPIREAGGASSSLIRSFIAGQDTDRA